MKLGLAEINMAWEDKTINKCRIECCVEKFSKIMPVQDETRLILFPEMSLTGFSMNTVVTADGDYETVKFCSGLSEKYNVAIGVGWVKKGVSLYENHYSIITPDEGQISDYIKIHPFSYGGEDKYFEGGNAVSVCRIDNAKIATAICYDLRFPEIFQAMSDEAGLIIVPANWPEKRSGHWSTLLCARAIENQSFVAGINCCGEIGGVTYLGESALYSPQGEQVETAEIIKMKDFVGKIFVYDFIDTASSIREDFPVKRDRREELYIQLKNKSL